MLELVYDKDVAVTGAPHTLELYVDETRAEAVAVFLAAGSGAGPSCREAWEVAREVLGAFAPGARLRVLRCARRGGYHWLDTTPPPSWRDAPIEEVRRSGLRWA